MASNRVTSPGCRPGRSKAFKKPARRHRLDPSNGSNDLLPIESDDKSTPAVFGDYCDIRQAIDDNSTLPIFYERFCGHD